METPTELRFTDPIQWALRERVKELTCLYGIAQVSDQRSSLPEVARRVVDLLPPAWQYPEVASARVVLDGVACHSPGFAEGPVRQSAEVTVDGAPRGVVEVVYREPRPDVDEGPFLKEERSLINEVARQLGLIVQRHQADAERARLHEQLRHADRLATVGQLAAGVAHELNEPLVAILGYAQLTLKSFGLPDQTGRDLGRIVKASLHAREIVRKLLIFARQVPAEMRPVALNGVVREGLELLKVRCARAGIRPEVRLAGDLPPILADPGQLQQVVINLGANAVQSMPSGGALLVETQHDGARVVLSVQDSGTGMPPDVLGKLFTPFFTTKDVGQGTGLGLSVVHGIVSSHGGTITAASEVGKGTRFEVRLPVAPAPPQGA